MPRGRQPDAKVRLPAQGSLLCEEPSIGGGLLAGCRVREDLMPAGFAIVRPVPERHSEILAASDRIGKGRISD